MIYHDSQTSSTKLARKIQGKTILTKVYNIQVSHMFQMFQNNVLVVIHMIRHVWFGFLMMHDMRDLQCLNAGITPGCYSPPPYKNLVPRFGSRTICYKNLHKLFIDTLPFPKLHLPHHGDPTVSCIFSPHYSE